MQSKSTFLENFWTYIHRYNFAPPPENYSGARFNVHTTWKQKTLPSCRLRVQSSSYSSSGENQPIDENESAVLMQTGLYGRPACRRRKSGLRESVLDNRLLVCMIFLKCKHKRGLFCRDAR